LGVAGRGARVEATEIGRILRQVVERKLYRELRVESFERYVQERLDLSPRTARRLVRLARAEHGTPAVAGAFREGRITLLQAEVLLHGVAQFAEPSHLVPLGLRAGRGLESDDAMCLSPPSRGARGKPGDSRAGARRPDLRTQGGEVPVAGRSGMLTFTATEKAAPPESDRVH